MSACRWLVHLCGRASPRMRACSGRAIWRDRRGRGGADRSAHPSGHLSASRRLVRVRYHGDVDTCRHDDDENTDVGDDADSDDGAVGDGAGADRADDDDG
eukprot:9144875-Pyramimonas_sp.AAC.1